MPVDVLVCVIPPSYTSLYSESARYSSASKAVVAGEVGGGRARKRGGGPERSMRNLMGNSRW